MNLDLFLIFFPIIICTNWRIIHSEFALSRTLLALGVVFSFLSFEPSFAFGFVIPGRLSVPGKPRVRRFSIFTFYGLTAFLWSYTFWRFCRSRLFMKSIIYCVSMPASRFIICLKSLAGSFIRVPCKDKHFILSEYNLYFMTSSQPRTWPYSACFIWTWLK